MGEEESIGTERISFEIGYEMGWRRSTSMFLFFPTLLTPLHELVNCEPLLLHPIEWKKFTDPSHLLSRFRWTWIVIDQDWDETFLNPSFRRRIERRCLSF